MLLGHSRDWSARARGACQEPSRDVVGTAWAHPGGAGVLLQHWGRWPPGPAGAAEVGRGCGLPGIPRRRFPAAPGERGFNLITCFICANLFFNQSCSARRKEAAVGSFAPSCSKGEVNGRYPLGSALAALPRRPGRELRESSPADGQRVPGVARSSRASLGHADCEAVGCRQSSGCSCQVLPRSRGVLQERFCVSIAGGCSGVPGEGLGLQSTKTNQPKPVKITPPAFPAPPGSGTAQCRGGCASLFQHLAVLEGRPRPPCWGHRLSCSWPGMKDTNLHMIIAKGIVQDSWVTAR